MKFSELLIENQKQINENQDLDQLAEEIKTAGPQVLNWFIKILSQQK
jgi:hypothetical protein